MQEEAAKHARAFVPDEIVEDLRHAAAGWSGDSDYSRHQRDLCLVAADEIERLRRRCEVYAAGVSAIADPLPGSTLGVMVRTALLTLDRVRGLESGSKGPDQ